MKYNSKTTAIPEIIPVVLICTAGIISASRMYLYLALLLHRDYFRRSDASLSSSFAPQGLFPPPGFISILLFCPTEIILPRPDASLSSSFAPQGLFPPVGFIPAFLFCSTGIISAGRIHLYLPLLFHRDYFCRPDSSPACSFVTQGLFPPAECISIFLFCPKGIILPRLDASLSSSFAPQGLFLPPGFIPSLLFCSTGIILPRLDASLSSSFVPQGLFLPVGFIPSLLFCSTGIILLRSDASLSCSFASQGLFRPARCIPALLFFTTGIISAARMHLYLPLLSHRDYFRRSDSSPACSFAPQGLFPPVGCIPSLLFCSTGIISASRMHL